MTTDAESLARRALRRRGEAVSADSVGRIERAEAKRVRRVLRPDASAYARGNAGVKTARPAPPAAARATIAEDQPRRTVDRRRLPAILAMLAALGGHSAEQVSGLDAARFGGAS